MKPFFLYALLTIVGTICPVSQAADTWQIVTVNSREYVGLENIAQFYELRSQTRLADNHAVLGDSRVRLELCSNPREIYVNGVKQWLSFPVLNQNGQVLVSRFDLAKTIEPCLRPTMISNLRPFRTVVLDAGHGGQDGGGHSVLGYEKEYTLSVVRDLKKSLEDRGLKVMLTRDVDSYLPLESRAGHANEIADSILVSIHFNSSADTSATGFEVFSMTPRGAASTGDSAITTEQFNQMPGNDFDDAGLSLATCVQHSLLGHLPQADRGVKRARFAVLRLTHSPSVLIEGGFLTNPTESQRINEGAWREKLADAIAIGVQGYQKIAGHKEPPKLLADYRSEQLPLMGAIVNPLVFAANPIRHTSDLRPVSNPIKDSNTPTAVIAPVKPTD